MTARSLDSSIYVMWKPMQQIYISPWPRIFFKKKNKKCRIDKLQKFPWRGMTFLKITRPWKQRKYLLSKIGSNQNSCYLRENWPWFDVINQKKTAMKIILFCTWKFNHSQECKIVRFFARNHCVLDLRSSRVFCVFIPAFSTRFLKHHLHHGYTEKFAEIQGQNSRQTLKNSNFGILSEKVWILEPKYFCKKWNFYFRS